MKLSPKSITIIRRALLTLACLGTALGLFVLIENWRGHRAWSAMQHELQVRGERLDFAALLPAPVPDDQNFLKAPKLAVLLYERPNNRERKRLLAETRLMDFNAVARFAGKPVDFVSLRDALAKDGITLSTTSALPAADVVQALERVRPILDEVRNAAQQRPRSALERRATPLGEPQVSADTIFRVAQVLSVRAAAEIELVRVEEAQADIVALQRLADAVAASPTTLLNTLVGFAMHGLAAATISQGCSRHMWSDAQLGEFQRRVAGLAPVARFADGVRGERAGFLYVLDTRPPNGYGDFNGPGWMIDGWVQQNKVAYCRGLDAEVFAALTLQPERMAAERLPKTVGPAPSFKHVSMLQAYDWLARIALHNVGALLNAYGDGIDRLRIQTAAWGVERHRLAHGRLPATLDELVPKYLPAVPNGIFDGQPLRYEQRLNQPPRIYSLGKNGRDDHGEGDDVTLTLDEGV